MLRKNSPTNLSLIIIQTEVSTKHSLNNDKRLLNSDFFNECGYCLSKSYTNEIISKNSSTTNNSIRLFIAL